MISKGPSDRHVIWIYDKLGHAGKTFTASHLEDNNNFITFTNGKTMDISYAWNGENVIFDFSRSQQEFINYEVIEQLKNGKVFSSKYQSSSKKYAPPFVIIFSNFLPDILRLSADKWKIYEIIDKPVSQDKYL